MDWLSQEYITALVGDAVSKDMARFTVAFGLAAWLHSRQVRKEIKTQFSALISVLERDLSMQSERLGKVEARMDRIENQQK